MIRAVLREGCIQPVSEVPAEWIEGQELIVEEDPPVIGPEDAANALRELRGLSAEIPPDDHRRMAQAIADEDRLGKEAMRGEMGLS